jgi:chromosomal replication initiation ATPase DnaA
LRKNIENPFDDVVEQAIIGSDGFIDRIKREYLLNRTGDKNEDHSLIHLQQSFSIDEIIIHVSSILGVKPETLLERKSRYCEARRLAMYCVCTYCRHIHSFRDLAQRFSVSGSALTQA